MQVDRLGVETGDEVVQQLLLFDLDLVPTFCLRNPLIQARPRMKNKHGSYNQILSKSNITELEQASDIFGEVLPFADSSIQAVAYLESFALLGVVAH